MKKLIILLVLSVLYVSGYSQKKVVVKGGYGSNVDTTSLSNRINQRVTGSFKSNDSVYNWINGVAVFAFIDSTGTGGAYTASSGIVLQGNNFKIQDTLNGAGNKLIWMPAKQAFRAGNVSSNEWDSWNIGNGSVAFGRNTRASAQYSFASGDNVTIPSHATHAIGMGGNVNASEYGTVALGYTVNATNSHSVAIGGFTNATSAGSVAIGFHNEANGPYSTALGFYATTTGAGSHGISIGNNSISSANNAVALGSYAEASGISSQALGYGAKSKATYSGALGYVTNIKSFGGTVVGMANDSSDNASLTSYNTLNRAFQVGIGNGSTRKNAVTTLFNGNTGLGDNANALTPSERLVVEGNLRLSGAFMPNNLPGTSGQILQSNGPGVAPTWVAAPSGGGTYTAGSGLVLQGNNFKIQDTLNGVGTKMMWIPGRNAFRAGFVSSSHWDINNIGIGSTAFGESTMAAGATSFAVGSNTLALGNSSTTVGALSRADGTYSFAGGFSSLSEGNTSFTFGNATRTYGTHSTSFGNNTAAVGLNSFVVGAYNDTSATVDNRTAFNPTNRIFEVGIGQNNVSRKNAITALYNGKIGIGTTTPDSILHLVGGFKYQHPTAGAGKVLTSDANGGATWQTPSGGGSGIPLSGTLPNDSITGSLKFKNPAPNYFNWFNNSGNPSEQYAGYIGYAASTPALKFTNAGATIDEIPMYGKTEFSINKEGLEASYLANGERGVINDSIFFGVSRGYSELKSGEISLRSITPNFSTGDLDANGSIDISSGGTIDLKASDEISFDASGTYPGMKIKIPANAGTGKVFTSDANGYGTWQTPSGGADGNFATTNLTATGNRTHAFGSQSLSIGGTSLFNLTSDTSSSTHSSIKTQFDSSLHTTSYLGNRAINGVYTKSNKVYAIMNAEQPDLNGNITVQPNNISMKAINTGVGPWASMNSQSGFVVRYGDNGENESYATLTVHDSDIIINPLRNLKFENPLIENSFGVGKRMLAIDQDGNVSTETISSGGLTESEVNDLISDSIAANTVKVIPISPLYKDDDSLKIKMVSGFDSGYVTPAMKIAWDAKIAASGSGLQQYVEFALSDETTNITTGTAKVTWRAPYALTITGVRSSLSTASSSGLPTVDINENGATVLSTKLTIDASEKTSTTAATVAVISDAAIADDSEITFDIDVAGTNAKGLKVKIYFTKN